MLFERCWIKELLRTNFTNLAGSSEYELLNCVHYIVCTSCCTHTNLAQYDANCLIQKTIQCNVQSGCEYRGQMPMKRCSLRFFVAVDKNFDPRNPFCNCGPVFSTTSSSFGEKTLKQVSASDLSHTFLFFNQVICPGLRLSISTFCLNGISTIWECNLWKTQSSKQYQEIVLY